MCESIKDVSNLAKILTLLYTASLSFVWKQNSNATFTFQTKPALFPASKSRWYNSVGLQDGSFMPCGSHEDMVVALDYPKLLLLNCFGLILDHLVIFDLGTNCHCYPDWKLSMKKCTEIPE